MKEKKIELEYNKNVYILEFNAKSVKFMETEGFDISKFMKNEEVYTQRSLLLKGALYNSLPTVDDTFVYELLSSMTKEQVSEIMSLLYAMVTVWYGALVGVKSEENGKKSKNVKWTVR